MLADALDGLDGLHYDEFEVCVVHGPTEDATAELLAGWTGRIKLAQCAERNLAVSRNLGIMLAAGEVVAFIDDDAVPEPEWLDELLSPYLDTRVGGAGGFVLDPSGIGFQYRYGIGDRLGNCALTPAAPMPELNFPYAANYPHLLGTNASFRRSALLEIGGFDEEYDYYLDETDICCRVIDADWQIVQVPGARVHHRYAPSPLRTERRVIRQWYSIVKNKLYFSLLNAADHHETRLIIKDAEQLVLRLESDLRWAVDQGLLDETDLARFRPEVDRAFADGLRRGLSGQRRLPVPERLRTPPAFLPFRPRAAGRRPLVLLSREYPPGPVGGIGQYTANLAQAVAGLGQPVRVVTRTAGVDESITFAAGVWIHRVKPGLPESATDPAGDALAYARRAADEVAAISARHGAAVVCAPIWDAEGVMVVRDGQVPVVTTLHTPLSTWLKSSNLDGRHLAAADGFVPRMLDLEREMLLGSRGIIANSAAILAAMHDDLAQAGVVDRVWTIPHGMHDLRELPRIPPPPDPPGSLRLLCVGRIEPRKGVDVLLEAALAVMETRPAVRLDLVGEDTIRLDDGRTLRDGFAARSVDATLRKRIRFHGVVGEQELRGFLAAADVVVVPSRFESFGLTALEAMIFGKPLVCSRAGGLVEVVEEGRNALLVEPGDVAGLAAALGRLLDDPALRDAFGIYGRRRYEQYFTARTMAERVIACTAPLTTTVVDAL